MRLVQGICSTQVPRTVADLDLRIKGGGVIQTLRFLDQIGLKIRRGGTSTRSTTAIERGVFAIAMIYYVGNYSAKNFRSDLTDVYGCLLPRKVVFTYNSLD